MFLTPHGVINNFMHAIVSLNMAENHFPNKCSHNSKILPSPMPFQAPMPFQ